MSSEQHIGVLLSLGCPVLHGLSLSQCASLAPGVPKLAGQTAQDPNQVPRDTHTSPDAGRWTAKTCKIPSPTCRDTTHSCTCRKGQHVRVQTAHPCETTSLPTHTQKGPRRPEANGSCHPGHWPFSTKPAEAGFRCQGTSSRVDGMHTHMHTRFCGPLEAGPQSHVTAAGSSLHHTLP